jgi:predicted ATPase
LRDIALHRRDMGWNIARDGDEQLVSPVSRGETAGSGQFVGREAQLAALDGALAEAQAGRGSLFLIGGEPGIGKSRLADTFARSARDSGAEILWGKCWEGAGAPAYWPWIQALRAHIRNTERADLAAQLGKAAADVVRMLPELTDLVGDLPAPGPETDSSRF